MEAAERKTGGIDVKKILAILGGVLLLAVAGYAILTFSASSSCSGPGEQSAPIPPGTYHLVQTPSRAYISPTIGETPERVMLYTYYSFDNEAWDFHDETLLLLRSRYGEIRVGQIAITSETARK